MQVNPQLQFAFGVLGLGITLKVLNELRTGIDYGQVSK